MIRSRLGFIAVGLLAGAVIIGGAGSTRGSKDMTSVAVEFRSTVREAGGMLDAAGGPDAFGYRWVDNTGGDTATFDWIELCGDPNALDGPSGDDGTAGTVLTWTFPFYGGSYTGVYLSTNGLIQFGAENAAYENLCPYAPGNPTYPQIAVYWDDLYAQSSGGCGGSGAGPWVRYRHYSDKFVAQWSQIPHYNNTSDRYSFEAIIYATGKVKLQYLSITAPQTPNSASIGIDAPGAGNGLEYLICNNNTLPNGTTNRAVWFYPSPPPPSPDSVWSATFGGSNDDEAESVLQTSDGGYIVAGSTASFGAGLWDFYVVKTNAAGTGMWSRTFGGGDIDRCSAVRPTADGGYILAGTTGLGSNNSDFYMVKINAGGDSIWTRRVGGNNSFEECFAVQQTSDGGYILAGSIYDPANFTDNAHVVKTDANGNGLWVRTFGGAGNERAFSIQQTIDGGYIVGGLSGPPGNGDAYLLKLDANGNEQWSHVFGGGQAESGADVQQTSDGGYILAGLTGTYGAGDFDVYLVKTDAGGNALWSRYYGGTGMDYANSVRQLADGSYLVGGINSSGAGGPNVWLLRVSAAGDLLWEREYGGAQWDECYEVQATSDGGYIAAGRTWSFGGGGRDFWLLKTGPDPLESPDVPRTPVNSFHLQQNYPNPFNAVTTVRYDMDHAGPVQLTVLNVLGQEVAMLVDGFQPAGSHRAEWNASGAASGVYLCRLQLGEVSMTRKMVLLK